MQSNTQPGVTMYAHPPNLDDLHVRPIEEFVAEFNQSNGYRFELTVGLHRESTVTIRAPDTFDDFRECFKETELYKAVAYATDVNKVDRFIYDYWILSTESQDRVDDAIAVLRKYDYNDDLVFTELCTHKAKNNTVDEIHAVWENLPETIKDNIDTYLGWSDKINFQGPLVPSHVSPLTFNQRF